jgi:hypothetical protein
MADKRELYRDRSGQRYAVPEWPSFETQQQVAVPGYKTQKTYEGSHVRFRTPETVYMNPIEDTPRIRAHELQHQIEGMTTKKGQNTFRVDSEQTGDVVSKSYGGNVSKAWHNNAERLGYDGYKAEQLLRDKLSTPAVQDYFKKIGFEGASYVRNADAKDIAPLNELLSDLSSYKTDLTKDSFLAKKVFNDPKLNSLIKSTTGMSGVVIGDSDYKPYSLEAGEAWYGRKPSGLERLKGMIGYQKGGLALAAQHLESKGRGRDKKLLHVSPRELQGLQAIAKAKGGSLTINPETGLPEAGFLEDILPMLAMGAATYFTAGAATPMLMNAGLGATSAGILSGAGAGALIGGVGSAIQGGDVGKGALMGGIGGALSGSLGAFGGAEGATGGFGIDPSASPGFNPMADVNAGIGINPNAGVSQASQLTGALKVNPQSGLAIDPLATGAGFNPPASPISPSAYTNQLTPVQATTYGARDTANSVLNAPSVTSSDFKLRPPTPSLDDERVKKQVADAANKGFFGNMSTAGKVGTVLGGTALVSALGNQDVPTYTEEESRLKRISPNFRAQGPVQPNPYYSPVYAAGGGGIRNILMAQGGTYEDEPMGDNSGMAGGGIASLGGYSDGGRMLKGPGDGMSDSIPAMIGRKQPARLADGEFVVPADVVSHLGNGSTDAGAKKLYAMMDKVRQARTGKKKQAPAVKTQKYMPA